MDSIPEFSITVIYVSTILDGVSSTLWNMERWTRELLVCPRVLLCSTFCKKAWVWDTGAVSQTQACLISKRSFPWASWIFEAGDKGNSEDKDDHSINFYSSFWNENQVRQLQLVLIEGRWKTMMRMWTSAKGRADEIRKQHKTWMQPPPMLVALHN
jgi:hypothetical protein